MISAFALSLLVGITPVQNPSLKDLHFLLGSWTSEEVTKGPDGKEIAFTLKGNGTLALEGNAVQIDEAFEVQGRKMANHILLTLDPAANKFRAWWFTASRPSAPLQFTGTRADGTLILTSTDERLRIRYDAIQERQYSAYLETKNGTEWQIVTRAKYTKN